MKFFTIVLIRYGISYPIPHLRFLYIGLLLIITPTIGACIIERSVHPLSFVGFSELPEEQ
jgi:hypothetical protein